LRCAFTLSLRERTVDRATIGERGSRLSSVCFEEVR
jgi:hypothetical protein